MPYLGEHRGGDSVGDPETSREINNTERSTAGRPNGKNLEGGGAWEMPTEKPSNGVVHHITTPSPQVSSTLPSPEPSAGEKFFDEFVTFVEKWTVDFSPLSEFASKALEEMDAEAARIRRASVTGVTVSMGRDRQQQVANALGALDIINKMGNMYAGMSILRNYNIARAEFVSKSVPGRYIVTLEVTSGHQVIIHSEESAGVSTKEFSEYFVQEITVPRSFDLRSDGQKKADEELMERNLTPEQLKILEDYRRNHPRIKPQQPSAPAQSPAVVVPPGNSIGHSEDREDRPIPPMSGGKNVNGRT